MRIGVKKFLMMGLVPARAWWATRRKAEIEEANAAGKKESVALSLFMEVNQLEVRKNRTFHHGHASGGRNGEKKEQLKAWRKQIFEVQTWRQVRGHEEQSRARTVIWAPCGRIGTPCCSKDRERGNPLVEIAVMYVKVYGNWKASIQVITNKIQLKGRDDVVGWL